MTEGIKPDNSKSIDFVKKVAEGTLNKLNGNESALLTLNFSFTIENGVATFVDVETKTNSRFGLK